MTSRSYKARVAQLEAENKRLREALAEIVETQNTRHVCKRHGGDGWAGEDECWCGISLDAEEKMRNLAAKALNRVEGETPPPY